MHLLVQREQMPHFVDFPKQLPTNRLSTEEYKKYFGFQTGCPSRVVGIVPKEILQKTHNWNYDCYLVGDRGTGRLSNRLGRVFLF